jgi:hypothetical protein
MHHFKAGNEIAVGIYNTPFVVARSTSTAPALQNPLQQLRCRRLGYVVAELQFGRLAASRQQGDAGNQAFPEFGGFQPATAAGLLWFI